MSLKPALVIGRDGPTDRSMKAAGAALARDGLIKIRLDAPDRSTRRKWLEQVASACGATLCGQVGHTASLFRPKQTNAASPDITP